MVLRSSWTSLISDPHSFLSQTTDGREEPIRTLNRGDYFGEQALLKTDLRTANVIAESDDVECLSLDREHFFQLVGELDELRDKDYADQRKRPGIKSIEEKQIATEFQV